MGTAGYYSGLISSQTFRFDNLVISGIDNAPVFKMNVPEMTEQEVCLFHQDVASGDGYVALLHDAIERGILHHEATPIVRFADGEYAFYRNSLHCNGLYQQAESKAAIKEAMPSHIKALRTLATSGKIAPLIYPGNVRPKTNSLFSFCRKSKGDDSAIRFVDFLATHQIELTGGNYIPFYALYAYLTSSDFCKLVNGRKICIINSECNIDSCARWFSRFLSSPEITFVEIPDSYVATRWQLIKTEVLSRIPTDTDLCLVGAGVGSLLICVDAAAALSVPAVDAGHVLNMMNGREDKSSGPRLYTIHKNNTADEISLPEV
jgi:hypothetical protein